MGGWVDWCVGMQAGCVRAVWCVDWWWCGVVCGIVQWVDGLSVWGWGGGAGASGPRPLVQATLNCI